MKVFNNIKEGLKVGKDKTVNTIVGIETFLKSDKNRVIIGIVLGGLSVGLIVSGYVKLPE